MNLATFTTSKFFWKLDSIDFNKDGKIDYFELLNFCGIPASQTVNSIHEENNSNDRSEAKETNVKDGKTDELSDEGKNILFEIHNIVAILVQGRMTQ